MSAEVENTKHMVITYGRKKKEKRKEGRNEGRKEG